MEANVVLLDEWSFYFFFLIKPIFNKKSYVFPILKKKNNKKTPYGSVQASPSSKQSNVNSRVLVHALKYNLY